MSEEQNKSKQMVVFWGCFVALITTSFAFITRSILCNEGRWAADFRLDKVQVGELFGAGIWPFAISIILFSLIIDRIGYRIAMFFSFGCYAIYGLLASLAYGAVNVSGLEGDALLAAQQKGYNLLYYGSIILGLGNGTVEAFINPVVATIFNKEKTKWLNILHAGWPGGLVLGGIITIAMGNIVSEGDWRLIVGIIVFPAIVYLLMLFKAEFPVNERVQAGATYREMLGEFGTVGAFIAGYLISAQLGQVFGWPNAVVWALTAIITVGYFVYTKSLGKGLLIFLILIMMPLAITELGTDASISGLMKDSMATVGQDPAWVLVYTSAIMMVLRFFTAGFLVKKLSPLGLLALCATLAIISLYWLSSVQGLAMIFVAATIYGFAKTYFWPTMLGIVSEQTPKGGALTLNAIAGIGMIAVGIIGNPLIGYFQEDNVAKGVEAESEEIFAQVVADKTYLLGDYKVVDPGKISALSEEDQTKIEEITKVENQAALARITIFPIFMLLAYLALIFYFKSKGGYKQVELGMEGTKGGTGIDAPVE